MSLVIKSSDGLPVFYRDPNSTLDYKLDLVGWFAPNPSDVLDVPSCDVTPEDASITVDGFAVDTVNHAITAFVSGAVAGAESRVHYDFGTVGGRIDRRTFLFRTVAR